MQHLRTQITAENIAAFQHLIEKYLARKGDTSSHSHENQIIVFRMKTLLFVGLVKVWLAKFLDTGSKFQSFRTDSKSLTGVYL